MKQVMGEEDERDDCYCEKWLHQWDGLLLLNCTCRCHFATIRFGILPEDDCSK